MAVTMSADTGGMDITAAVDMAVMAGVTGATALASMTRCWGWGMGIATTWSPC